MQACLGWMDVYLPVQISANIILVLSKALVIISEAETCSNLEKQKPFLKDRALNIIFTKDL